MSDKEFIVGAFRKVVIAYAVGAIFFTGIGFFLDMSEAIFWAGLLLFVVSTFPLFLKIFPSKGRSLEQKRQNMRNYGPRPMAGFIGFTLLFLGTYFAYSFLNKAWDSSLYIGMGLSCAFNFLYGLKHLSNLEARDEIQML